MVWRCATAGRGGWGWWDDGGDAVITVFEGGEGGGQDSICISKGYA